MTSPMNNSSVVDVNGKYGSEMEKITDSLEVIKIAPEVTADNMKGLETRDDLAHLKDKKIQKAQKKSVTHDTSNKWTERLARPEIYETGYLNTPEEDEELKQLALTLGFIDPVDLDDRLKHCFNAVDVRLRRLFGCEGQSSTILKRGPVLCSGEKHELILMTHGFMLARAESSYWAGGSLKEPLIFEECQMYEDVKYMEDMFEEEDDPIAFVGESFIHERFTFRNKDERDSWWEALATVLVQDRLKSNKMLWVGWQDRLIIEKPFDENELASGDTSSSSSAYSGGRRRSSILNSSYGSGASGNRRRSSIFDDLIQSLAPERLPVQEE